MVGHTGSPTRTVYVDMTLTQSKVKVTGLLNFQKLAKPCMHVGGDDRQPPCRAFWCLSRYRFMQQLFNDLAVFSFTFGAEEGKGYC